MSTWPAQHIPLEALVNEIAVRLVDSSFIVICGADRYIDSEQHHANGTSTVHIKTKQPAPWEDNQ